MQPVLEAVHDGAGVLGVIALVLAVAVLLAALIVVRRAGTPRPIAVPESALDDPGLNEVLRDLIARQQASGQEASVDARLDALEARSRVAVQHVGLVRFNPFSDTGGDQSFALALLDGDANGIVLSSLHSRLATRVYVKQVFGGRIEVGLSNEEAEALRQAGLAQVGIIARE
jgi:hypothetical protein